MTYNVVYWNRATEDVYDVIRSQMPRGLDAWSRSRAKRKAEWHAQIRDVDLMIVADWAVTEETLAAAPKLRMVQHQGVGHERIDKEALKARGIPLALCPAGTTIGVAEHTVLLILAVYKRLVVADTQDATGDVAPVGAPFHVLRAVRKDLGPGGLWPDRPGCRQAGACLRCQDRVSRRLHPDAAGRGQGLGSGIGDRWTICSGARTS